MPNIMGMLRCVSDATHAKLIPPAHATLLHLTSGDGHSRIFLMQLSSTWSTTLLPTL